MPMEEPTSRRAEEEHGWIELSGGVYSSLYV